MSFSPPKVSNNAGPGGQSAEDAEQEAAERNLIRRCVDYHGPALVDLQDRLYRVACRSHHVRNSSPFLQPHASQIRLMGMPIAKVGAPVPSDFYLTYRAHVTRAKNSTPIVCLSWTPGGRRLLTGNHEGEFTLWDGSTFLSRQTLESFFLYTCFSCSFALCRHQQLTLVLSSS
jgi:polyadenylation factor subunit 2